MWPLPVSELHMAGRSSVRVLHKLGIHTIGELAHTDADLLTAHLKSHGRLLWEYANGIDDRPVESLPARAKGIGNSTTLSKDALTKKKRLLSCAAFPRAWPKDSGQPDSWPEASLWRSNTVISPLPPIRCLWNRPPTPLRPLMRLLCACSDGSGTEIPSCLLGVRTTKAYR